MPSVPYTEQRRVSRFRNQRWLLDAVIKVVGPEFDQSRLQYLSAPLCVDHRGPVLSLASMVKRWDDIVPEFAGVARRFEVQACAASVAGHEVSAGDAFFAASVMYGGAQWPIFADTELLRTLESKKTECFLEYAKRADHHVEAVEVPYRGKSLAAYLHLPPGYAGGRLPCLVMIEGMDAAKELAICSSGDRFLRRGFACLVIDGPGQGTSLTRGIWYEPEFYGEVGTAAIDLLSARREIDADRIMAWGLSFGSFWATQMAAAEPRFAACAVMYTCFQPYNWPLLEMASPSFRQRMMFMAGIDDEDALEAFMLRMDVRPLSAQIAMPYFVMAGEDDSLSDISCTLDHMNAVVGPKTLVMYAGEEHGMGGSRSSQLGTPFFTVIADWLVDRAAGHPAASTYTVVDRTGRAHSEPWGERRTYQYGAPLGVQQLFAATPPVGLS
ncbi:esterase FrsA (plasmid) [Polymorphobacter sp. PAMC 29334]|uniref:alpha/beta hydrolase family protein n=1 Tax=Polymorphobacter sp. PAMC 29334 TaxID=2862331 RepID=UPI001C674F81|nr:alpha/beta hydrolase [Polymorphobacter sp. PAMC 29334]QYE37127.1 esterase FrsA [Polymorphobacter sp. PAMC 29334]